MRAAGLLAFAAAGMGAAWAALRRDSGDGEIIDVDGAPGGFGFAAPDLSSLNAAPEVASAPELSIMPTRKVFDVPPEGAPYADAIRLAETRYGLPDSLLARVLWQESRYRPDIISGQVKSPAGAVGIAQFMPATAKQYGINPLDPFASIDAAAKYLRNNFNLLGDWVKAVAGYNWGEGNVMRQGLAVAPLETRNYIKEIFNDVSV